MIFEKMISKKLLVKVAFSLIKITNSLLNFNIVKTFSYDD